MRAKSKRTARPTRPMTRTRLDTAGAHMNADTDMARIKLPPTLDLAAGEGLLDTLRGGLDVHPRLGIDAGDVETLTVPCVQVIVAALQSCDQISIEQPSAAF